MAIRFDEFEKAVCRLEEALAQPKDDFMRDSVILGESVYTIAKSSLSEFKLLLAELKKR